MKKLPLLLNIFFQLIANLFRSLGLLFYFKVPRTRPVRIGAPDAHTIGYNAIALLGKDWAFLACNEGFERIQVFEVQDTSGVILVLLVHNVFRNHIQPSL
jgi:hypothetical protein